MAETQARVNRAVQLPRSEEVERLGTAELRAAFLVDDLFAPGELRSVSTDLDRMLLCGVVPFSPIALPAYSSFGTAYFTERRELGVVNLGPPGRVSVGGVAYTVGTLDCLYVGLGEPEVEFAPLGEQPPLLYLLSCPAHQKYPTTLVPRAAAERADLGDDAHATRRTIRRYIHPAGARSCQLVMGVTELEPNSVWNTMPPHTHGRRAEVYLYFDLGAEVAVHLMGEPERTRSLIVREKQAVLSPAWSIHCAAGTANYKFVWGMAGENQAFSDMDAVDLARLR